MFNIPDKSLELLTVLCVYTVTSTCKESVVSVNTAKTEDVTSTAAHIHLPLSDYATHDTLVDMSPASYGSCKNVIQ